MNTISVVAKISLRPFALRRSSAFVSALKDMLWRRRSGHASANKWAPHVFRRTLGLKKERESESLHRRRRRQLPSTRKGERGRLGYTQVNNMSRKREAADEDPVACWLSAPIGVGTSTSCYCSLFSHPPLHPHQTLFHTVGFVSKTDAFPLNKHSEFRFWKPTRQVLIPRRQALVSGSDNAYSRRRSPSLLPIDLA